MQHSCAERKTFYCHCRIFRFHFMSMVDDFFAGLLDIYLWALRQWRTDGKKPETK